MQQRPGLIPHVHPQIFVACPASRPACPILWHLTAPLPCACPTWPAVAVACRTGAHPRPLLHAPPLLPHPHLPPRLPCGRPQLQLQPGARRAGIDVDQALADVCEVLPGAEPTNEYLAALHRLADERSYR